MPILGVSENEVYTPNGHLRKSKGTICSNIHHEI